MQLCTTERRSSLEYEKKKGLVRVTEVGGDVSREGMSVGRGCQ